MVTTHIVVSGSVQGVGYRQFVKSVAKKHNVNGWVINTSDGKVEALLQGLEDNVQKVIAACKQGPFLAAAKDITITQQECSETFYDITILPTN